MFSHTYKSPLRYPGGKQRDLLFLAEHMKSCKEFREPFMGGGSILLYALKKGLSEEYWGNDLNSEVANFWSQVQLDADRLATKAWEFRDAYTGPKLNCDQWRKFRQSFTQKLDKLKDGDNFDRAVRFFILNRSTSGGSTESGGMTAAAYCDRFTLSSVKTLRDLNGKLSDIRISQYDYEELLSQPGEDVFIFLDPPYLSAENSGLYGKAGDLHRGFDHKRLANNLWRCEHNWLMTIDDCEEVRQLYAWAEIHPWKKSYGMTNVGGQKSKRGAELLVANFPLQKDQLAPLDCFKNPSFNVTLEDRILFFIYWNRRFNTKKKTGVIRRSSSGLNARHAAAKKVQLKKTKAYNGSVALLLSLLLKQKLETQFNREILRHINTALNQEENISQAYQHTQNFLKEYPEIKEELKVQDFFELCPNCPDYRTKSKQECQIAS